MELYETPMLVDVEEVTGAEAGLCITGGGCGEDPEEPVPEEPV